MANYNIDTLAEIILSELDKLNKSHQNISSILSNIEEKSKKEIEENTQQSVGDELRIIQSEEIKKGIQHMEKLMHIHVQKLEFYVNTLLGERKEVIPTWVIFFCSSTSIALIISLLIILI